MLEKKNTRTNCDFHNKMASINVTVISTFDLTYKEWQDRSGISDWFYSSTQMLHLTYSLQWWLFCKSISTSVWEICDTESCHLEHSDLGATLQLKMNMLLQVFRHPTAWKAVFNSIIRLYEISQPPWGVRIEILMTMVMKITVCHAVW
jgi:hypothetical protein